MRGEPTFEAALFRLSSCAWAIVGFLFLLLIAAAMGRRRS